MVCKDIVNFISVEDSNVFFISGGFEVNFIILKGIVVKSLKKKYIIISLIEYLVILKMCDYLRKYYGF